jgi:alpha-glucosidase
MLLACDPGAPPLLPPASHVLSDGTRVEVDGRGAFELFTADGRALAATAPGQAPTAHTFTDRVSTILGFFTFRRGGDTEHPASRFVGSERVGDEVVLRFSGAAGLEVTTRIAVEAPGVSTRITTTLTGLADVGSIALPFRCDEEASFAGFGEQYNTTDQRGESFALWVEEQGVGRDGSSAVSGGEHTTYFPMPWWIDWRGFGVMVDTPARVLVDLCATDPAVAWVEVEDDAPIEALVFHGPGTAELVDALGAELGRPSRPPAWAFSPWIGVQGGSAAVRAEVAALEAAGIPFSAVWVQDWIGGRNWTPTIYDLTYRWVPDDTLYPDLVDLVAELRTDHDVRFLAYNNPFVIDGLDHWAEMDAAGTLLQRDGATYRFPVVFSQGSMADLTHPAAVEYVEGFLRSEVMDLGFDGWMADFGEWLPTDTELFSGEDARLVHNLYPALWHRTSRAAMDELRPDGDWVIFSRSGWLRDHAEAQIVWIGDQEADFSPEDGLPTVVPAMLNLGLSGIPFVTHDIAGYSGGPSSRELFFRWVELGAFTPFFRTHEGLLASTNWSWDRDAETTAHFRRFARIHQALGPELMALADEAAASSMPMVRHLASVFPDDVGSRAVSDEYLLGDDLLVAPVVVEGATTRDVYLPPGAWFHVFTGARYEGGTRHTVEAPLGTPPVFARGADRADLRAIE